MKKPVLTLTFILLATAGVFAQGDSAASVDMDLQDMAAAERAFSATAVKDGFRDSFIKFFADDGIGFGPHPERTKEVLQKRPPQTGPRTSSFSWQPMFGDISAAGDMGYTTGPVLFTDLSANPKPPSHGMYFSVWQKQPDKTWKVAIDMGIDTPEAVAPIDTRFTAAVRKTIVAKDDARLDTGKFEMLDQEFSADIEKNGVGKTYGKRIGDKFRVHRKGMMPIVTMSDLDKFHAGMQGKPVFKFIGGKIARSRDLAFTYGRYETKARKEDSDEGYYVHVWRRDAVGWKLVADIQNPLPKKEK